MTMPSNECPRVDERAGYCPPYPLFIQLVGQPVVVIGAGEVAQRKIQTLLSRGARVRVVAPEATDEVRRLADDGAIAWERRPYEEGDLAGALVAFAATSDRAVNERVYAEATARPMLVNVVDVPDLCNAIVPSIMGRGRLQVAVSTDGASPETAKAIRRGFEERFPAWWEQYMDLLHEVRLLVKDRVGGPSAGRARLYRAVLDDERARAACAAGDAPSAEDVYASVVAPLVAASGREA